MNLDEAIKHCRDIVESCDNQECSVEHYQLMHWLIELKEFRRLYGPMVISQYIMVTKTNGTCELVRVDDIVRYTPQSGIYQGIQYHTKLYCKDHTHYVVETVEEITEKITHVNQKAHTSNRV